MNVLSLFDGISCGQIAFERAGIKVDNYFASEVDKNAIKVTQNNYHNTIQLGDVTKMEVSNLPGIDILIGGFPCQDLSIASFGRKGLQGERSKLFWEFVRILKSTKPKYFLLENVARMKKEDKEIITEIMGVEPIRINSELVSEQLRDRLYWTNIPKVTQPNNKGKKLQDILDCGYTDRVKSRCLAEIDSRPNSTPVKMFHRYYATGFTTLVFKDKKHYTDCKKHYDENFKGMKAVDIFTESKIYEGVRYMTQRELERCQTVPSGYTSTVNRNGAASLLGNGWTVDVIAHIFKGLKQ